MCSAEQRRPLAPILPWPCRGGRLHGAKEAQQPAPGALAAGWGPLDLTAEWGPRVVSVASQLCRGKGKATPGEHHTCTWTNLGSLRSRLLSAQTTRCREGHWGEITALWDALSVRISSFSIVTGMQETFRDQLSFFFFFSCKQPSRYYWDVVFCARGSGNQPEAGQVFISPQSHPSSPLTDQTYYHV